MLEPKIKFRIEVTEGCIYEKTVPQHFLPGERRLVAICQNGSHPFNWTEVERVRFTVDDPIPIVNLKFFGKAVYKDTAEGVFHFLAENGWEKMT
jgi:hypothetical protein